MREQTRLPTTRKAQPTQAQHPRPEPIQPFATQTLEHPRSPVRTRRRRRRGVGFVRRILWPAIRHFTNDQGFVLAGHIAFTAVFAAFPFTLLLLAIAGFAGQGETAAQSIDLALEILPPEVAAVLSPAIDDIRRGPHGTLITFSVLLTLWFASAGLESLRHALNLAFDVKDRKQFWAARLESLALTIASAVLILIATVLLVGLPIVEDILRWLERSLFFKSNIYVLTRYGIGLLLLFVLTVGLYLILPNLRLRIVDVLPGAILAVTIWMATSVLYSQYLRSFGRYSIIYGSLGGVIFTLFFFFISAVIFIFGAQINAALYRERLSPTFRN